MRISTKTFRMSTNVLAFIMPMSISHTTHIFSHTHDRYWTSATVYETSNFAAPFAQKKKRKRILKKSIYFGQLARNPFWPTTWWSKVFNDLFVGQFQFPSWAFFMLTMSPSPPRAANDPNHPVSLSPSFGARSSNPLSAKYCIQFLEVPSHLN